MEITNASSRDGGGSLRPQWEGDKSGRGSVVTRDISKGRNTSNVDTKIHLGTFDCATWPETSVLFTDNQVQINATIREKRQIVKGQGTFLTTRCR